MKKINIFRKLFFLLTFAVIPLLCTIAFAAWYMISEVGVKPKYNPNSAFYVYLNEQEVEYNGNPQLPSSDFINMDFVEYKYKKVGEQKYTNGAPTNAGQYYIYFESKIDQTEYLATDVLFTIKPASVEFEDLTWPTFKPMYWGNSITKDSNGDTTNGSFSFSQDCKDIVSPSSRGTVNLTHYIRVTYTPNDKNYAPYVKDIEIILYAVADVAGEFYSTIDEAILNTTSGTIYVMITGLGSDDAKTIGITLKNTNKITLAAGVTLYIPYRMTNNDGTYTYNDLDSTIGEKNQSWGANFMVDDYTLSAEDSESIGRDFADSSVESIAMFLKNVVYIGKDKELIISNSTSQLIVSGILGVANAYHLQGHTSRDYSEIRMKPNSKITNNGTVILGGYIKEVDENSQYVNEYTATVRNKPGAYIYMPYVINDNRGGPNTIGCYGARHGEPLSGIGFYLGTASIKINMMPFSRLDFPNIQTTLIIESGSVVEGFVDLFTTAISASALGININIPAQHNAAVVTLFSKDGMDSYTEPFHELHDGTVVTVECKNKTPGITKLEDLTRKTYITVSKTSGIGGITFKYIKINISVLGKTVALEGNKMVWPFSDMFEYNLINGESYMEESYKILPGCSITVHEHAKLTISGGLSTYTEFNDDCTNKPYPSSQTHIENGYNAYGELIVNGTLIVENGASIGGIIRTKSETGKLEFQEGATFAISTEEGSGNMDGSYNFTFYRSASAPIVEKCKIYLYTGSNVSSEASVINTKGTFFSKKDSEGNYGWYSETAYIYYDANGGILTSQTNQTGPHTTGIDGYSPELNQINQSVPTREHYIFDGWYTSPEGNSADLVIDYKDGDFIIPEGILIYANTTLYAKWIPITYKIVYSNSYTFADYSGSFETNDNTEEFNIETSNVLLLAPVHENNYVFDGWYYKIDNTRVYSLNGAELIKYFNSSNNVEIYAKWYPEGTETFKVNYVNDKNNYVSCVQSEELIIESEESWNNYTLPNISYRNNEPNFEYYFHGWYTSPLYEDKTLVSALNPSIFGTSKNVTLYAKWTLKPLVTLQEDGETIKEFYIISGNTFTFESYSYPLELSQDKNYISEYGTQWVNGNSAYDGGTTSPAITSDITFTCNKKEIAKYYKATLTCNNTKLTVSVSNGFIIEDENNNQKVTSITFEDKTIDTNKNSAQPASGNIYILIGSTVTCSFTYTQSSYNGYKIYENGAILEEDVYQTGPFWWPNYTGKPANPPSFTMEGVPYEFQSSSGIDSEGACVFSSAQILMGDGTIKQISDVKIGDIVTTWSFEEGKFVSRPVIFVEKTRPIFVEKTTIYFDDNTKIEVAFGQSFFDIEKLEYFSLSADNVSEYIGVNIMTYNNGNVSSKKIVDYKVEIVSEDVYELITGYDFSFIFDNVMTMEPFLLYKLPFEISSELKYDSEKMKEDIEEYGLYTYDDWSQYVSEDLFDLLNGKYFKVAISKGHFTIEYLIEIIERYLTVDNLS